MSLLNEINKIPKIKIKRDSVNDILILKSKTSTVAIGLIVNDNLEISIKADKNLFNEYLWGTQKFMKKIEDLLSHLSSEELCEWNGFIFFTDGNSIVYGRIKDEFIFIKPEFDLIKFNEKIKENFMELKSPKEQLEIELIDLEYELNMQSIELAKVSNKNNSLETELKASKEKCSKFENKLSSVEYQNEELKKEIEELKKLTLFHDSKNKKMFL